MLLLICTACEDAGRDSQASKQLEKYLPLQRLSSISVKQYQSQTTAKYPQYYWHLITSASNLLVLERSGFQRQDRAELEFVQKVLAEDPARAFTPSSGDRLFAKETERADVKMIVQGENDWFIWVLRH